MPGAAGRVDPLAAHRLPLRRATALLLALAGVLLLTWIVPPPSAVKGIAGYEPLHTFLETIAIVVAALVFAVGWHAQGGNRAPVVEVLACTFLGVALLDFSHTLSFAGMPAYVTPSDPEKAINFWLAARLLAGLALLAAAVLPWREGMPPLRRGPLLGAVLAYTAAAHALFLFGPELTPRTFIPGIGLTAFKIGAEVALIVLNLAAAAALWRRVRQPQPFDATALLVAVSTMAMSELFFTLYGRVTDIYNLMGHVYKVVAYVFLYRAVFVETVARPLTELRRGQDELRVSQERLQQATRVAGIGIFDHDHLADTIHWSPEQRAHYGFMPDEPVTLAAFLACVHPDDLPRIAAAVERAHDPLGDGLFDVDHRIIRRDGTERVVTTRSRTQFGGSGAARHLVRTTGAVLDITERKATEQSLLLRDKALRTSFNAVAMSDPEGRLNFVNLAFAELWGLDGPDEALGRLADEFWDDPADARRIIAALGAGDGSWRGELKARRRDGSTFDVAVWATLATTPDGSPLGLMASFLDITQRKRTEAELQSLNATLEARVRQRTLELERRNAELLRAEKLAALGSLVAGVAHELNTPIGNAVMVSSSLAGRLREFEAGLAGGLRRSALDSLLATAHEVSDVLQRNLDRAAHLIGSFKQVAVDQSSYQRRHFEIAEVVDEIVLALRPTLRQHRVDVADESPPGLSLDSYPGPLGQVLINLVNNAVMHAFEDRPSGQVRITACALGETEVRIRVSDDGRGIPGEQLEQIFDPFFTTRLGRGGTGLGLHIAFTLVTGLLGGRIEVRSEVGRGTEFTIELPRTAPAAASPTSAETALQGNPEQRQSSPA